MSARRVRDAEVAVIRPAQARNTVQAVAGATERRLPGALEVPIEQIVADAGQPRQDWEHDDGARRLEELAESIREFGIMQPLVVREEGALPDGRQQYVVIAGARRRAAAERANLTTVPVVVRRGEATLLRLLQLSENLQRHDLSPLDEARAYQEIMDAEGLSPPMLADRLHLSAQHVRDRLRILNDQVLADAVERRQIAASAARDISQLPERERNELRDRVARGETVQRSDVADVRARLDIAGIVNPRRKGSDRKKQTAFVNSPSEFHLLHAPPQVIGAEKQTTFVNSSDAPHHTVSPEKQTLFVNSPTHHDSSSLPILRDEHPEHSTSDHLREQADDDVSALNGRAARVARAIDQSLHGPQRALVMQILREPADEHSSDEWWMEVYTHLRQRLALVEG